MKGPKTRLGTEPEFGRLATLSLLVICGGVLAVCAYTIVAAILVL